jgi:hypothetical protein
LTCPIKKSPEPFDPGRKEANLKEKQLNKLFGWLEAIPNKKIAPLPKRSVH